MKFLKSFIVGIIICFMVVLFFPLICLMWFYCIISSFIKEIIQSWRQSGYSYEKSKELHNKLLGSQGCPSAVYGKTEISKDNTEK